MKLLSSLARWASRVTAPVRNDKTSRSHLVGMYLSQANSRDAYSPDFQANRQRRNGRFAGTRERA